MTIYQRVQYYTNSQLVETQYLPLKFTEDAIISAAIPDPDLPVLVYPDMPDFENGDVMTYEVPVAVCTGSYNGNYPTI